MIWKLLQLPDFTHFAIRLRAAPSVFCLLNPKAAFSILPAMKKETHPAFAVSSSSVERTFSIADQPFNNESPANWRNFGNFALCSTWMLPASMAFFMGENQACSTSGASRLGSRVLLDAFRAARNQPRFGGFHPRLLRYIRKRRTEMKFPIAGHVTSRQEGIRGRHR
jgi:hypothetical protein